MYAHIGTAQDAVDAVRAGVDVLAHGIYEGDLSAEQISEIATSKVPIVYTAWAFEASGQTAEGQLQATAFDRKFAPERAIEPASGQNGTRVLEWAVMGEMAQTCSENHKHRRKHVKALFDAGVPILAGSDSPFFAIWAGSALHHELEELVVSGIPPAEVLLGATAHAAQVLEDNPNFGTIERGKTADLILVDGDPLSDISSTQRITHVIQRGQLVHYQNSLFK